MSCRCPYAASYAHLSEYGIGRLEGRRGQQHSENEPVHVSVLGEPAKGDRPAHAEDRFPGYHQGAPEKMDGVDWLDGEGDKKIVKIVKWAVPGDIKEHHPSLPSLSQGCTG